MSKGKDTEVVVKEILSQNERLNKEINTLRTKLKDENSNYKKNEQNLELLKMKK